MMLLRGLLLSMSLCLPFTAAASEDEGVNMLVLSQDSDFFYQISKFLKEAQTFLLDNFDYNQNGVLEIGQELNDAIKYGEEIISGLIDIDQDGRAELHEMLQVLSDLGFFIKEEGIARFCEWVILENDRLSETQSWLRPIFSLMENQCLRR